MQPPVISSMQTLPTAGKTGTPAQEPGTYPRGAAEVQSETREVRAKAGLVRQPATADQDPGRPAYVLRAPANQRGNF